MHTISIARLRLKMALVLHLAPAEFSRRYFMKLLRFYCSVRPIHHGGNGKTIILTFQLLILSFQWTRRGTMCTRVHSNWPKLHTLVPHLISRRTRSAHQIATGLHECVANSFVRLRDAEECAIDVERSINRGAPIRRSRLM